MTIAARLQPVRAAAFGVVNAEMFADLTWEQIADLRENIEKTKPTPEKLADAVEATSPKLAAEFRRQTRQEITTYATFVVAVLQLLLGIYQVASGVAPAQITQIINEYQTTVVNLPSAPSPPPAPPAPADSPTSPPPPQHTEEGAASNHP